MHLRHRWTLWSHVFGETYRRVCKCGLIQYKIGLDEESPYLIPQARLTRRVKRVILRR